LFPDFAALDPAYNASVIASAAKQSIEPQESVDCFVRCFSQ
jgi:hypothetical protein